MKQAKLDDLFDYLPKSNIKAGSGLEAGAYPFYTSSEVQSKYLNEFQHRSGCLVFGTGGKASVHLANSPFSTSTDCITIRPKPAVEIDAAYVFHYFKGNMQVLENGFKGAGLKHISKRYLSDIVIPHPEKIDDQRRIVYFLDKVERLITQRKSGIRQLDALLRSVFLDMFGDPLRNEMGWDKPSLRAFGKISTGNTPPRNEPANYNGDFIEWIKTDNIRSDAVFVTPATEHLSEAGVRKGRTVTSGALLVACIAGSVDSIGRAALTNRTVSFNQQINAIQPSGDINPLYLHGLFKFSRAYIQRHATKGMKKILTKGEFEKITMIKPPLGKQNRYAVVAERIEDIKHRYQQSLVDLEALYGALSQQAFKGELDLSRVPLPGSQPEDERVMIPEPSQASDEENLATFLSDNGDLLAALEGAEARKGVIAQWLEAYCGQLGRTPLSVRHFMVAAQTRVAQLHPDSDFELGAKDYEYIKNWVFEALAAGRLAQAFDDAGNRIELKAVEA